MRCASGSPDQLGIEGIRNRPIESAIIPKARKLDQRSISPRPPAKSENPSTSSRLPDDRARQRAADDVGEPFVDRDQGDDQLGGVAERGVEEAADPGSRVLRRVLGRLADQPGERDQRSCREGEERRVADVREVVERDDDGPEGQPREEYSSSHLAQLAYPRRDPGSPLRLGQHPRRLGIRSGAVRRGARSRARRLRRRSALRSPPSPRPTAAGCCRSSSASGRTRSTTRPRSLRSSHRSASGATRTR